MLTERIKINDLLFQRKKLKKEPSKLGEREGKEGKSDKREAKAEEQWTQSLPLGVI